MDSRADALSVGGVSKEASLRSHLWEGAAGAQLRGRGCVCAEYSAK